MKVKGFDSLGNIKNLGEIAVVRALNVLKPRLRGSPL